MATHLNPLRSWASSARGELRPLIELALPVVAAEVGWMTMGVVDTLLVGRLGAAALGGVSIGGNLFFAVAVFGMGILLSLDFLVSHAHGGGEIAEAHRSFLHGIYLSLLMSAFLMALIFLGIPHLGRIGIGRDVLDQATPYVRMLTWGMPAFLLFVALRRYLQALGQVRAIMFALVSANLVNLAGAWTLIFGRFGAPRMGTAGAGLATCLSRGYLFLFLLVYILIRERRESTGLLQADRRFEMARVRRLMEIGLPSAVQLCLEVGVFAVATMLAGRLGAVPLAAYQVALVVVSFTFMVPLGISSAGAVRVGHALGAGDARQAARAGAAALLAGIGFMSVAAVLLLIFPAAIMRLFTSDPRVVATGSILLRVAGVFQIFDGTQIVATGILRGTGDTRRAMFTNLMAHWFVGLPLGTFLAFGLGLGVVGLWSGLYTGITLCGIVLMASWIHRIRRLVRGAPAMA